MANKICEINSICRLCLFDDQCILFPMSYLIDSSLTEADIERFTGLELFGEEKISYIICVDCANKLKKCALFRALCLSSDVQFKRMCTDNRQECISPENDNANVELSVEAHESAISLETMDIKNAHKIEESTIDEHDKESNVEHVLKEPPYDESNVSDDDWGEGFEVNSEQHNDAQDSKNIKPQEDEDTNSTSENNEEKERNVSTRKLKKSSTIANANTTTPNSRRFYRRCYICGRDVSDLKRHVLTHEKDGSFACPYCPEKMSFRTHLKTHIKTVHRKEIGKTCEICGQVFLSPISHRNHMTSKHGEGEYECEPCSKKFTHIKTYNTHVRRVHRRIRKEKPKQLCGICGAMVVYISSHLKIHAQEKKYSCPHCPLKMVDSGNLTRHIKSVHLQKPYKSCEICNIGFKYPCSYRSHMLRLHGIGKKIDCSKCSKQFYRWGALYVHMGRAHSTVRKHVCKICGMAFKFPANLRDHQLVHTGERPYACNLCPKRFKSRHGRNTHQLTHSGIVFPCTHCEKSYRYKGLLNMHIRQKHLETMETVNT